MCSFDMVGQHLGLVCSKKYDIEAWCTVSDKAVLLAATAWNQPHKEKRTFVLFGNARADDHVLRPNKTPRRHAIEQRREAVADAFEDALGGGVDD